MILQVRRKLATDGSRYLCGQLLKKFPGSWVVKAAIWDGVIVWDGSSWVQSMQVDGFEQDRFGSYSTNGAECIIFSSFM